jgi:hypothetical protein
VNNYVKPTHNNAFVLGVIINWFIKIPFDIKCIGIWGFYFGNVNNCCKILENNSINVRLAMPPCVVTKHSRSLVKLIKTNLLVGGSVKVQPTTTTFSRVDC